MLAQALAGWRLERLADGVALVPPGGRVFGGIRIRERVAPLVSADELIARAAGEIGFAEVTVARASIVTDEGEHGTIARIAGERDGLRGEHVVAILVGDDWYTRIDGITAVPDRIEPMHAIVRALALAYPLGLGALRRRRVRYAPPLGWTAEARGLVTVWRRGRSTLTVFPARPLTEPGGGETDRLLQRLEASDLVVTGETSAPRTTASFANGVARSVTGRDAQHEVVALHDARFVYVVHLASTADAIAADREALDGVVDSLEPVPAARTGVASDASTFASWAE